MSLHGGDTDSAIDTYLERGRVTVAPSAADARSRMLDDWMNARIEQTTIVVSTSSTAPAQPSRTSTPPDKCSTAAPTTNGQSPFHLRMSPKGTSPTGTR